MNDLLRLAWLNTYRQKQRTAITAGTIALCTLLLILLFALSEGFVQQAINNYTNSFTGKIQAHAHGYRDNFDFYKSVKQVEDISKAAQQLGWVAAPRSFGFGLVAAGNQSAGAMFTGVTPKNEAQGFRLHQHLQTGEFLQQTAQGKAVIGRLLAINLGVQTGDELIVLVQAADGSMGNMLLHVGGIFAPVGDEFDRSTLMLHKGDFENLFVSSGRIHQVAFNTRAGTNLDTNDDLTQIKQALLKAAPNNEVKVWQELFMSLALMAEMMSSYLLVFAFIFGIGAAIGVLNTLLMASFERLHEFGIMKAIGTSSLRLFSGVLLEGLIIGLLGSIIGCVLALPCVLWLQAYGINISQWSATIDVMGVAFDPVWRAHLTLQPFIMIPAVMLGLSLVAAIYPAWLVSRLNPTEAMHEH